LKWGLRHYSGTRRSSAGIEIYSNCEDPHAVRG
jgi:hypothetical protein